MKKIQTLILLASLARGVIWAADSPAEPASPDANPTSPPVTAEAAAAVAVADNGNGNDTNCLRLNFRGVPLDMVLNYLSEAAGFIIVLDTPPKGRVDVWSNQPVTKEEAVELLNSVLNRNGYAAIRKGRTLTIINKDEAKTRAIPVRSGSDPESIPDNDEMVTQIIPVRYVEAGQIIKDLQPLISIQTAMTANESGNAIVITDTQCNIRRVAEVIKAIDSGAEDMTVVKVFRLQHADAQETADLITSLFPDDSRSGGSQSPVAFGGPGGLRRMFGGGSPFAGGRGGAATSNTQNQRIRKRNRVVAVPDLRTSSVV
ncbi:MAG TPA: secretin N-terminal domain-containing protein, partial [Clostridia bacterium]|nr:secretin N-terminal domain-containing protein [Clostridia bacterium]